LDNRPELLTTEFVTWCERRAIELRYIQPGKPDQNAFIERFNRSYREEVLNAYVFTRPGGSAPDQPGADEELQRGATP
jgi:putative transposase